MQLSEQQAAAFDRNGYLVVPDLFDGEEVAVMKAAATEINAQDRIEIQREKDGTTPRTAFAAHNYNETFAKVAAQPTHHRASNAVAWRSRLHTPVQGKH
jgi:ectoine hydroxylase